jgi:hypothetical protein
MTDTIQAASGNQEKYKICTMHRHLAGTFHRSWQVHHADFVSTIMNIDTTQDGFMKDLTIGDEIRHFNNCTGYSCIKIVK